jgi:hypothetical protein
LAERYGILFVIGLLTHLPGGDVTKEGQISIPPKQVEISGVFSNSSYTERALSLFSQIHSMKIDQKRNACVPISNSAVVSNSALVSKTIHNNTHKFENERMQLIYTY